MGSKEDEVNRAYLAWARAHERARHVYEPGDYRERLYRAERKAWARYSELKGELNRD